MYNQVHFDNHNNSNISQYYYNDDDYRKVLDIMRTCV